MGIVNSSPGTDGGFETHSQRAATKEGRCPLSLLRSTPAISSGNYPATLKHSEKAEASSIVQGPLAAPSDFPEQAEHQLVHGRGWHQCHWGTLLLEL